MGGGDFETVNSSPLKYDINWRWHPT